MEKTLPTVANGLTDAGNLRPAARNKLREFAEAKHLDAFTKTPKGEYVMEIADVDGKVAYLKLSASITIADNLFDEPKAKVSAPAGDDIKFDGILD